jgi:hypothetical protein
MRGVVALSLVVLSSAGACGGDEQACPGGVDEALSQMRIRSSDGSSTLAGATVRSGRCTIKSPVPSDGGTPAGVAEIVVSLPLDASDGDTCTILVLAVDGRTETVTVPIHVDMAHWQMCPNNTACCSSSAVQSVTLQSTSSPDQTVSFPAAAG